MHKFLIASLAAAAVAVPVLAQQSAQVAPVTPPVPVAPPAPLASMGDRVLTRAEVQQLVLTHFTRIDANRDGVIAGDEMTRGRKHDGGRWQGENRHAMVKHGEPMGDSKAAFDRIDANRDGAISRDEFAKARELRIEKRMTMGRDGAAPGGMRMHHMGGMRGMLMLKMADANKDGRVTLQEANAGALRHFDMIDTNRDGRVTPEERRAGRGVARQNRVRETG